MKLNELEKHYITKEGIVYTPKTNCVKRIDENGNAYGEYTIIKSAEEVYQEWLKNKDKNVAKEPTEQEKINAQLLKSNLGFQKALAEQKKINANLLLQIQALQKKEGNN